MQWKLQIVETIGTFPQAEWGIFTISSGCSYSGEQMVSVMATGFIFWTLDPRSGQIEQVSWGSQIVYGKAQGGGRMGPPVGSILQRKVIYT